MVDSEGQWLAAARLDQIEKVAGSRPASGVYVTSKRPKEVRVWLWEPWPSSTKSLSNTTHATTDALSYEARKSNDEASLFLSTPNTN